MKDHAAPRVRRKLIAFRLARAAGGGGGLNLRAVTGEKFSLGAEVDAGLVTFCACAFRAPLPRVYRAARLGILFRESGAGSFFIPGGGGGGIFFLFRGKRGWVSLRFGSRVLGRARLMR